MGREWLARHHFYFLLLLESSLTFYVDSYAFPGNSGYVIDSKLWDKREEIKGPQKSIRTHPEKWRQILQQETDEHEKGPKAFAFDKEKNLSEIDRGPGNETKIKFLTEKEHFEIRENKEEENGNQLGENIFHLLSSENFLSQTTTESQSKDLQRTKREAEDEQKKRRRCRCRRVWRRTGARRRRRRRRNGQQNRRRRRRRRRGRRRCVCRRRGGGGGKTDGGKDEDSGGGGDEGGEEGTEGEGDGDEGEAGGEEEGEGGEEEDEGGDEEDEESEGDEESDESTDEESSKEDGEGESSHLKEEEAMSPGGVIPIPSGSVVVIPGHPPPPHPLKSPSPEVVAGVGGILFGSKP